MIRTHLCLFMSIVSLSVGQNVNNKFPLRIPASLNSQENATCPSPDAIDEHRRRVRETLQDYYNTTCSCGGPEWTRVAYLDMSDPNQQCPSNWMLTTSPVRGCGRSTTGGRTCDSVIYPVNGRSYSTVCGRINAYQQGNGNAFYSRTNNIDSDYVSGVSLTHGAPGSRQHIWTFAASLSYDCSANIDHFCPCTNINVNWPYQIPSFIGDDYFCESAARVGNCYGGSAYYPEDPLWDGQGCPASSTCCGLNSPPWFCKTLPETTSDDIEIRQCHVNYGSVEDTLLFLIDIYVK